MSFFCFPRFRITDALGNAIVGGHIHFYETGTTTPKDTYSNPGLTTPNANPVVSGSDGWTPEVWMSPAIYKVVIEDAAGVVLKTVDPYHPGNTVIEGVLNGTSSTSTAAVTGTNSSTGAGVHAKNTGSGPGAIIEADTTSPVSAALRIVPQDAFPSSPQKGDLVVNTHGGRLSGYDGVSELPVKHRVYGSTTVSMSVDETPGSVFSGKYTIPIGTLRNWSQIEIYALATVSAQVGSPALLFKIEFGGTPSAEANLATAGVGAYAQLRASVQYQGAGFQQISGVGHTTASGVTTTTGCWSEPTQNNATTAIDVTVRVIRTGGTSASVRLNSFVVYIS